MIIPFFINRNCNDGLDLDLIGSVSFKEIIVIIIFVIGLWAMVVWGLVPIMETTQERAIQDAKDYPNKELTRLVIDSLSDNFLDPIERIKIDRAYSKAKDEYWKEIDNERKQEDLQKLREKINE